nr:hypothetical protein MACL_00003716 [Theileria orientalis]
MIPYNYYKEHEKKLKKSDLIALYKKYGKLIDPRSLEASYDRSKRMVITAHMETKKPTTVETSVSDDAKKNRETTVKKSASTGKSHQDLLHKKFDSLASELSARFKNKTPGTGSVGASGTILTHHGKSTPEVHATEPSISGGEHKTVVKHKEEASESEEEKKEPVTIRTEVPNDSAAPPTEVLISGKESESEGTKPAEAAEITAEQQGVVAVAQPDQFVLVGPTEGEDEEDLYEDAMSESSEYFKELHFDEDEDEVEEKRESDLWTENSFYDSYSSLSDSSKGEKDAVPVIETAGKEVSLISPADTIHKEKPNEEKPEKIVEKLDSWELVEAPTADEIHSVGEAGASSDSSPATPDTSVEDTKKEEDSILTRSIEPLSTTEERKSLKSASEDSKKADKEVPLTSGKVDLSKKVIKPVRVPIDKIGTTESKRSKKEDKKLSELIDTELLSKTNLKGNTLPLKLSNHLITKLTENLGYFAKHPNNLVDQLEKLSNQKLPKEYKGKLLSELARYSNELELISSEASSVELTDKETISQVAEAKEELESRFAEILVPILVPLLKPLLENIIIRVTRFKRIFFGKTDEELEEYRKKELDKLFVTLKEKLEGGLVRDIVEGVLGEKEQTEEGTDKDKTSNKVRDPEKSPKGDGKTKEVSGRDKEKTPFQPPEIKGSTNEAIKNRKKLTEKEKLDREAELEGIDLEGLSPLPEPLTPEEKEATERAEKLLKEGRVKEYRELVKRLNDYYEEKIRRKEGSLANKGPKEGEDKYYPEIFKHLKKEKSAFREASMLLALGLGVFYAVQ